MSQDFDQGPRVRQDPGDALAIAYDFERDSGEYSWEEMIFTGVVEFRFTSSRYCSAEQVAAYDTVQALSDSAWVAGIPDPPPTLRHFRVYFDDIGCYEVLATGFVPPTGS